MRCREGTLVRPSINDRAHAVDVTLHEVSGIPPKPQHTTRGLSRGLYNCLTTPSKSRDEVGEGRGRDNKDGVQPRIRRQYEADGYGIRALIRLPPMTTTNVTGEGGRVPGGARPGPPPARKLQRLQPSYDISSRARRLGVGDIIDDADGVEDRVHFGRRGRQRRRRPGRETRLSLVPISAPARRQPGPPRDRRQHRRRRPPRGISPNGRPRLPRPRGGRRVDARRDARRQGRRRRRRRRVRHARVRREDRSGGAPYIVDAAWLDRHSGLSLSILERLACVGLAVADEEEDEGTICPRDDDDGGAIVVGCSRWIRTPG